MKYLFIVQGEGRGHMTQAIALSSILRSNGHEVVGVLLGKNKNRDVPSFFAEKVGASIQTFLSPAFVFGRDNKHISLAKTLIMNMTPGRLKKYVDSIEFIHKQIKTLQPDVVINFYEILSGFVNLRFREKVPFVSIGHQFLLRHPDYKFGHGDDVSMMLFRLNTLLCGIGATKTLALSFYPLDDYKNDRLLVVPPLLRKEVLEKETSSGDFVLGYLLNFGFAQEITNWHHRNPSVPLRVFWDKKDAEPETKIDDTLTYYTISDEKFLSAMAGCNGYISTAGFESICEAFYMNKPVMMIPAHVEQEINAADAASTGLGIRGDSFDIDKLLTFIETKDVENTAFQQWVKSAAAVFLKHLTSF